MNLFKKWRPTLVIGILLGLLALWSVAAPLADAGNHVLGGHPSWWYLYFDGWSPIGCTADMNCHEHCVGTEWDYCWAAYDGVNERSMNCTGGAILIGIPQEAGGGEGLATTLAGCEGLDWCPDLRHVYCTY